MKYMKFGTIIHDLHDIVCVRITLLTISLTLSNAITSFISILLRKSTLPSICNDSSFGVTISNFGSIVIKLLTIKVFKHSETTLQTPKQEINFNMCIHHMKICLKHSEITLQTPKQEINFNVCILHMKYMNFGTIAYTS